MWGVVLSPATVQVVSYLAHEKQPPAELADPACRPSANDAPCCRHVQEFLSRHDKAERYAPAFHVLWRVGHQKRWFKKVFTSDWKNAFHPSWQEGFAGLKFRARTGTPRIAFSNTFSVGPLAVLEEHSRMLKEWRLQNRLNSIGKPLNMQVPDTGVYTALKFLHDVEAKALDIMVERDAPELKDQVKKFNDNTKFTFRTLGIDPERPLTYSPTRKPRDLTPDDIPNLGNGIYGAVTSGWAVPTTYPPGYGKPL